jgi:hemerythrin-like domain-containing protein
MATSDPIDYLRAQYIKVMDSLQVLVVSLKDLSDEDLSPETLDLLLAAAEEVRGRVWTHSERIQTILLPVLESKLEGNETVPVILREHKAFLRGLERLTSLVRELKADPSRKDLRSEAQESIQSMADILPGAIQGEDEVLYPLARRLLTPEEVTQVQERLDRSGLGEKPKDAFLETEQEHENLLHILSGLTKACKEFSLEIVSEEGLKSFSQVQKALAYEIMEHNKLEEEVLFKFMETIPPLAEMTRELREEHLVLRDLLKQATLRMRRAQSEPKEAGEILEDLVRRQSLHIYKENILLFPMARRLFSEEKLTDLAHRVAAFDLQKKRGRKRFVEDSYGEVANPKTSIEEMRKA